MPSHKIIRLVLLYVLLYNVHLSICDPNLPDGGLCPTGEHDLEPCECISMGHKMAGLISIECGPSTNWTSTEDIQDMFRSVDDYPTTHVYRFNMTGTNVSGTLEQPTWGPLDFHQIYMDNNKIWIVNNHAFLNSSDVLTHISLKNNEIFYFHWDILKENPHLEQLDLQGNNLSFIPSWMSPESEIIYLDLSWNIIDYVGHYAFENLHKLKKLDLSHNLLEKLDDNTFANPECSNNLHIILSNNLISYISPMTFRDVHPEFLDLRNNLLTTVNKAVFWRVIQSNTHSLLIEVEGNPILCDCRVAWVKEVENFFSNFGCYDNFGNPTGQTFDDLEPSYFDNCPTNTDTMENNSCQHI